MQVLNRNYLCVTCRVFGCEAPTLPPGCWCCGGSELLYGQRAFVTGSSNNWGWRDDGYPVAATVPWSEPSYW